MHATTFSPAGYVWCKMIINKDIDYKLLKNTFRKRNINVLFCETFDESKEIVLDRIPRKSTVGIGHSQTLQNMRITETLIERGNTVFDKVLGKDRAETTQLKKKALLADYYITGSNAVSEDGGIVNIDHSGNRAAALAFGPDKVIIIVGKNKITKTKQEAVSRAKNMAAIKNAERAGYTPPCVIEGKCVDCISPERVCNVQSIIEGQQFDDRITLIIVNAEDGF